VSLGHRLVSQGYIVIDRGCTSKDPVDYPDVASSVCSDIISGRADLGVLLCGTGIGMCNAASRYERIVAALCTNEYMARMSRLHNDANVLCLGGRVVGDELAISILNAFLESEPMTEEKYLRRRAKVEAMGRGG